MWTCTWIRLTYCLCKCSVSNNLLFLLLLHPFCIFSHWSLSSIMLQLSGRSDCSERRREVRITILHLLHTCFLLPHALLSTAMPMLQAHLCRVCVCVCVLCVDVLCVCVCVWIFCMAFTCWDCLSICVQAQLHTYVRTYPSACYSLVSAGACWHTVQAA